MEIKDWIILIFGIVFIGGLIWLFVGVDVSGRPLDFQINCNPNNTECHVSFEETKGYYYGLMAVNHDYSGNSLNYTISKGNCVIKNYSEFGMDYIDGKYEYPKLSGMEVRYSYEVTCYSLGKLKLEELWK